MSDQQGMPEVIGNMHAYSFCRQHACLQRLIQHIKQGVLVNSTAIASPLNTHCTNNWEFKGTAQDGRAP